MKDTAEIAGVNVAYNLAQTLPLFAAIIAPFSTLLDIPALTQPWYERDGQPLNDFHASVILSAIGLFFNIAANALLLIRFSSGDKWWRIATKLSMGFWITKLIVALVNLGVFGIRSRKPTGVSYLEGFWCAVVSVIVSGAVVTFLVMHWLVVFRRMHNDPEGAKHFSSREIRVFGRHYMLQVTWFMSGIGIFALIMSRLERWPYFDGIYFTVVTVLTVGFGDLRPTTTASRIVLFPFIIFLVAQLGNIIGMTARFFEERTRSMQEEWQRNIERRHHERRDADNPTPDLTEELKFLEKVYRRVEMKQQLREITISLVIFMTFWLIGALIFCKIEEWTYGDALYFCYIFFLTIGYGDFAPQSSGGRVFFVVYSLLAVPVMTSFAFQAVTSILSYLSNRRLSSRENAHKTGKGGEAKGAVLEDGKINPHADLIEKAHEKLDAAFKKNSSRASNLEEENESAESKGIVNEEEDLADRILSLATKLEGHARRLLVGHLSQSSDETAVQAGTLLKADWNVQRRELLELLGDDADSDLDIDGDGKGDFKSGAESDLQKGVSTGKETLEEVLKYRECFANILAAGSRLKGLEGHRRQVFERRKLRSQSKEER